MRVYSKKTYMFKSGDEIEFIRNEEIKDVKNWVADDMLFQLAVEDGSIEVIETAAQQKNIEKGTSKRSGKNNGTTDALDNTEGNIVEESSTEYK